MATASSQLVNDDTIEDIDVLLGSGINLDQVALWESEKLHLMNESPECAKVLRKMTSCVMENARKIQEAQKLLHSIGQSSRDHRLTSHRR
jgi:hypothetical protein